MRTSKKLVLTAAATVASVLATSFPTAAAGPFPLEITWGTWVTVLGSFELGPGSQGAPPCPGKPNTLALRTDTPNVSEYRVSGVDSGQVQIPAGSGNWYWANLTVLAWNGTYAGSSPYTLTGTMALRLELAPVVVPGCTKGTLACRITGQFAISSATSTYTGSLPNAVTGDYTSIDAVTTSGLVASPCNPPFSALGGSPSSLVDLGLTVQ